MFYSHQLLARKAPLGQIWMAATLHAKINRRNLHRLNIIKICEEILNPSVPMALRLSGILMGGVVIVYERKVKLLFDDVSRLLVEINEAWKVKAAPRDRTLLPKGRTRARYEAVTLPAVPEVEQPMMSKRDGLGFDTTAMKLDDLKDAYIQLDPSNVDLPENHHQADPANITLLGDFGSCMAETDIYDRFERFDIEDDDDPLFSFTQEARSMPMPPPSRHEEARNIPIPPPSRHEEARSITMPPPSRHDAAHGPSPARRDVEEGHGEIREEEQPEMMTEIEPEKYLTPAKSNMVQVNERSESRQRPMKRKARARPNHVILDEDHLIIPGVIYQDWLGDCSNLVKKRRHTLKILHPMGLRKVNDLMDLPPVALLEGREIHYPAPLMELWRKCAQERVSDESSSGGGSSYKAEDPPSHSPPRGLFPADLPEYTMEDFHSEVGQMQVSIEKLRENIERMEFHNSDSSQVGREFESPRSPTARTGGSNPSSGSGNSFLPLEPEVPLPSGRMKRRQLSSSTKRLGTLDPVQEEFPLQQNARDAKLRRLSEKEPNLDFEVLEETGPTQTPYQGKEHVIDKITESIHSHLKIHFDTPGVPKSESLDQLTSGMNRKRAAQFFYQTCVLASLDIIKVEQEVAYGDISISRGPKM